MGHLCFVSTSLFTEGTLNSSSNGSASALPLTCANLTDVPFAKDAVTILVNSAKYNCIMEAANPYMTQNMIQAIWNGQVYNGENVAPSYAKSGPTQHTWSEFWSDCPTDNIVPDSRAIGSDIRQSFLNLTGVNDAYEQNNNIVNRFPYDGDIESDINSNASHIGYASLSYIHNISAQDTVVPLPVKQFSTSSPILPTNANVLSSLYPYSYTFHYYYYYKAGFKTAISDLANWLLSPGAQGDIAKAGFVPINTFALPCDVNLDHTCGLLDLISIGGFWGLSGPPSGNPNFPVVRGWIRQDVNYDGVINMLDLVTVGNNWGATWGNP